MAAVLVVLSMLLALLCAKAARLGAGLESGSQHLGICASLSREDLAGALAHVGTVEVEPYAAGQHLYVLFANTSIGAGGAGLGAVEASLNTLHQGALFDYGLAGVCLDHQFGVGHCYSPFSRWRY